MRCGAYVRDDSLLRADGTHDGHTPIVIVRVVPRMDAAQHGHGALLLAVRRVSRIVGDMARRGRRRDDDFAFGAGGG